MNMTFNAPQPMNKDAIGRVVSTAGSKLVVLLTGDDAALRDVHMGSLVSIQSTHGMAYGLVSSLDTRLPSTPNEHAELKLAEISLLGEVADQAVGGEFRRGVSRVPPLNARVCAVEHEDMLIIYALCGRTTINIGTVYHDARVPAQIGLDELLSKHFAFLGMTGSGKSCGVTVVLKRILEHSSDAHIVILDPHGEYARAFGSQAEILTIENFRLPYWLFTFDEFTEVLFGKHKVEMAAEVMCLRDLVVAAKLRGSGGDESQITVDSPVPYLFSNLIEQLDIAIGRLNNSRHLPTYLRLKEFLTTLRTDGRFEFMFDNSFRIHQSLAELLGRLFRVPAGGKPIAVFDLSGISSEVLNVVVGVVSRLAFDFACYSRQRIPVLLVCDEAHRFASQSATNDFALAKRALSQIATEGRKYGISLAVVSQRPSELAATILSQCNTVIAFRTSNERDQEVIRAAMSDAGPTLSVLPFLSNSEAVAIGEGVPVPMRLRFTELPENERPQSSSAKFSERWNNADSATVAELNRLVAAFRQS